MGKINQSTAATLCFILDGGDNCLMLKREREPHLVRWNAPGGKLLPGESPLQCCRREVQEETGLALTDLRQMGWLDCIDLSDNGDWRLYLFRGYHPPVPILASEEGAFAWLNIGRILTGQEQVVHNIPLFLPLLLKGILVQGCFEYRDDVLQSYVLTLGPPGLPVE